MTQGRKSDEKKETKLKVEKNKNPKKSDLGNYVHTCEQFFILY